MSALRHLLAICAALAALTFHVPASAQGSPSLSPDRQVLVMVRHPPDHFRPDGGYGGTTAGTLRKARASASPAKSRATTD